MATYRDRDKAPPLYGREPPFWRSSRGSPRPWQIRSSALPVFRGGDAAPRQITGGARCGPRSHAGMHHDSPLRENRVGTARSAMSVLETRNVAREDPLPPKKKDDAQRPGRPDDPGLAFAGQDPAERLSSAQGFPKCAKRRRMAAPRPAAGRLPELKGGPESREEKRARTVSQDFPARRQVEHAGETYAGDVHGHE